MSTPLIEIEGMSAGYANAAVVRNLDLTVGQGEVVALLGPNGAGKTTTLLTISGLVTKLKGSVRVLGQPVKFGSPHRVARRGLAHVPEDRSLFFELTVAENLSLGLHGSRSEKKDGLARAVSMFPALSPLMDRRAGLLSGGEQQMLAMARAMAARPKVLMVDEMSLGLAPIIVERMLPIVRSIADETGVGVLIVEQHIHMALGIADRAYVLNHGECVLQGRGQDLATRRDLLEASYLGDAAL